MILNKRQLCDLELLLDGSFLPLTGFLREEDYKNVVENMRLIKGDLWPIPITLDVSKEMAEKLKINEEINLKDEHSNTLAVLKIGSIYKPDKKKEAINIYGTDNINHPGVFYLMNSGDYYIGGDIKKIQDPIHVDYIQLRKRPIFPKGKNIIGFQTRNPIHKAHFDLTQRVLKDIPNSHLFIHPVVGETKLDDIEYTTRVKCYQEVLKYYEANSVTLSLLNLAMRMAGPKEALLHALIRKNWGCTHFIVGRDHAGCSSNGVNFYDLYAAQKMVKNYEKEMGIDILLYEGNNDISGTKLRTMLTKGEKIPEEFVFPKVGKILEEKYQKNAKTIFLTGLSSSGKSTISHHLKIKLQELGETNITCLDGDEIRKNISPNLGFTREERIENIKRIGYIASLMNEGIIIISAIAPYRESREYCRSICKNFTEVYLSTPLNICEQRDVKKLYEKRRKGLITNFIGIDDEYEIPTDPEISLDTNENSIIECVEKIISFIF
jgi:sulfate adenylyltransferase